MKWMTLMAVLLVGTSAQARQTVEAPAPTFAGSVDLVRFGQVAVQNEGRIKSFDSHASTMMHLVSGPRRIDDQAPAFTYLDMIFRAERYAERPVIYLKNKPMRRQVAEALRRTEWGARPDFDAEATRIVETGLISREQIQTEPVATLLSALSRDLIKTAKYTQAIQTALAVSDPMKLLDMLRIVPPASGDELTPWSSMADLTADMLGRQQPSELLSLDEATGTRLRDIWLRIVVAWRQEDAAAVNAASGELADVLAGVNADLYPARNRLAWESWYFHMKNLTWVWIIYALALVPLLLSVVFRWSGARWVGLGLFLVAFGFQTFALILRWYVADRWPNSNMFEAVTTSTWFGGVAAIVLEMLVRRGPMRSVFALASAAASMVAFMCAHFQPMYLNPNISNRMPVLHDVWLYIHTNVIIFSYCLIFMAAVTAIGYLIYRVIGGLGGFGGTDDFARVGGAGSLIMTAPDGSSSLARARTGVGQVLDGTTMILVELSFIMLWAGLVMGAIWADHSWGRPWGWDPKEVFALNTFIVFAVLIHVRLKVKDKGLWTAIVALAGAFVMLFNWIAINFVITGLHSYA